MILFSVVFSPVNLNWEKLPQFLRKALGKTKITIGQYKFYPFLVKCLKRLYMCKCLYGYLESRNILYPLQFGFRQKCSTNHALIQITESIRNSIDNNEFGCGIFIDLKKAFEKVNHSILLSKLNHYGVRGKAYDWFQSYLSNREQFVCINGHKSDSLSITCGVPQGSIRGPQLFLLCILMIYQTPRNCLVFTYLLMTLIYIVHVKTLMILN